MKYYLISIQKLNDGTNPVNIFTYDGYDDIIIGAYHSTLASNYANENLTFFCVEIIDENGDVLMVENHAR